MNTRTLFASLLVPFAALALSTGAHAQERRTITRSGPGGGAIKMGAPSADAPPPLSRDRLLRYAKVLELSPEQTQAAEHLYNTYVDAVKKQQKDFRERIDRAREDAEDAGPQAMMKALSGLMQEQGSESVRQRDQFLTDLKSILEPAQAGNWDKLERLRRRDNWLARGVLSGSNVDLFNIVDTLKLAPAQRTPLNESLSNYDVDLDRPLQERETILSAPGDASGSRSFNGDDLKKHLEAQRVIDAKVQDVNARYARQLAELVPTDKRAEFDQLVKAQTFRRVYKDSTAAKRAQSAAALAKLSQDQRDKLNKALDQYRKNAAAVNDRWADAITKAEKSGQTPLAPNMFMGPGKDASPELADAKKARRALESDLKKAVEETLTPDQLADLPKPNDNGLSGGRTMIATFDSNDGRTSGGPVTIVADDLDEDDEGAFAFVGGGPGGGGGVMVIQQTTTNANGETQTQVDVTTSTPPGDKKDTKKK